MKIFISPAKSLDLNSTYPSIKETKPFFIDEANSLNDVLKSKSINSLSGLMNLSDKLSQLNWERIQNFKTSPETNKIRPAIFTFNGDVYSGFDPYSLSSEELEIAQNKIRILSGLYGILKPFDQIQPYRLEMGTPLKINESDNLYEFWMKKITRNIIDEINSDEIIVNLASKEYSSVVDFKSIKNKVISPIFKDFKNGKFKIISFYAKKARGAMSRHLVEKDSKSVDDILDFSWDGYSYSMAESKDQNSPVFIR